MADCVLTGVVKDAQGIPKSGVKIKILKTNASASINQDHDKLVAISGALGVIYRVDANGVITATEGFIAPQSSSVWLQGYFFIGSTKFSVRGGVKVDVPASPTATLESLGAAVTGPTTGLTVQVDGDPLSGLFNTINFDSDSMVATVESPGVLSVASLGGGGGGGDVDWGDIDGTIPDQTDLQSALNTKQPLDTELTALAGLTSAANKVPYFTGAGAAALADFSAYGRSIVAAADEATLKALVGLGNVDNTSDANKPISTATQTALDLKASIAYVDASVIGLLDDRGNYDASVNTFPASGGSGSAGAVLKGDLWIISVTGTLGGTAVNIGDQVRALVDTPGQTASNWAISEASIGYVPLNRASNLSDLVSASSARSNLGLIIGTHVQAWDADLDIYAGISPSANVQTLLGAASFAAFKTSLSLNNVDNTSDASKPISTLTQAALDLKSPLASPTFTGIVTLPNDTVAFAKMQNIATARILGRTTASSGDIEELNAAAVSSLLSLGSLATVTPTGTPNGSKFLRDDNSWAVVGGSPGGSAGQVQFNDTTFGGQAGFEFNKNTGTLLVDPSGLTPVELVTNGTFTGGASGWTLGTGWAYGSNKVTHTPGGDADLTQAVAFQPLRFYRVSFNVSGMTQGVVRLWFGGTTMSGWTAEEDGDYEFIAIAQTSDGIVFDPTNFDQDPTGAFDGSIDNVSAVELPPAYYGGMHTQVFIPAEFDNLTDEGATYFFGSVEGSEGHLYMSQNRIALTQPKAGGDVLELIIENSAGSGNSGAGILISSSDQDLATGPAKCSFRVHGDGEDEAVVSLGYDGATNLFGITPRFDLDLTDAPLLTIDPANGAWDIFGSLSISSLTASQAVFTDGSKNLVSVAVTGTGDAVRATSPTLVTPILGTPTSGNLSNCTVDGTNGVGFRIIPQNSQSTNYTAVLADSAKHVYHPTSDDNPRTFTIPANGSVAYPIGTALTFVNDQNTVTISITTDTLVWSDGGGTGSRTLAENGIATALKVTSTRWLISGTGLS